MKATMFREHGGPDVLCYGEVPDPVPDRGEVLVKVGAVTVNHGPDTMTRSGTFGFSIPMPHVSGSDPAGEVVAIGSDVADSRLGQRVAVEPIIACTECDLCLAGHGENYCRNWRLLGVHRWGGRAEHVVVPARNLVRLPDNVDFEQAACLGMSYLTAYHGIVRKAQTRAEDTVLVVGASGGFGSACIQIASDVGARVIAVTREAWKRERAAKIGADLVVDNSDASWPDQVLEATGGRGVSVLSDNVGPATWGTSLKLLDRTGRFLCSGGTTGYDMSINAMALYREHVTAHFYMCGARADLVDLVELVRSERISPVIDSRYAISDAARAEERVAGREHFGNVVLVPDSVLEATRASL